MSKFLEHRNLTLEKMKKNAKKEKEKRIQKC